MIPQPPDELKLIRPFIQRGNQMAKVDPVITYYCYYWAVRLALEKGLHTASPECTTFISSLMEDLETRKEAFNGDDRLEDDMVAHAYVETFALRIFDKGSRVVEAGRATEKTPETLQAAAVFLELTKIFAREPEPEMAKKTKYAKFHAARLLKALKEGTELNPPSTAEEKPPPPTLEEVSDEAFSAEEKLTMKSTLGEMLHPADTPLTSEPPSIYQDSPAPAPPPKLPSASAHEAPPSVDTAFPDTVFDSTYRPPSPPPLLPPPFRPQSPPFQQQSASTHVHIPSPAPPASARENLREEDLVQAQKYAKWAISALDYEDVDNAIQQFRSALATLGAS